MREVIRIPASWLPLRLQTTLAMRRPKTAEEMRQMGYVINARTWPAIHWEERG